MSLESSASEPAMRGLSGITGQAEELSRRFKQWVKRPGHRRQVRGDVVLCCSGDAILPCSGLVLI